MADLPILPEKFKLKPRDDEVAEAAEGDPQLLKRDDVDQVVNACDSGREGRADLRLHLRDGEGRQAGRAAVDLEHDEAGDQGGVRRACGRATRWQPLERAARSRSEADWLVGMNATRAATIRLPRRHSAVSSRSAASRRRRSPDRRAASARSRRSSPSRTGSSTATFEATEQRGVHGRYLGGEARSASTRRPRSCRDCEGRPGEITKLEQKEQTERVAAPLRPDEPPARREQRSSASRPAGRSRPRSALRGARRRSPTRARSRAILSGELVAQLKPTAETLSAIAAVRAVRPLRPRAGAAAARAGSSTTSGWTITTRSSRPTSSTSSRRFSDDERKDLRPRREAIPRGLPSAERGIRAHARRDDGRGRDVPHERQDHARGGLARPCTASSRTSRGRRTRTTPSGDQSLPPSRRAMTVDARGGRGAAQGDAAARGATTRRVAARRDGDGRQDRRGRASSARR